MTGERTIEWEGKYIRIVRDGRWEYVERCGGVHAVVILAEHDGKVVLIEQARVPLGNRKCIELPAGLVGDEDDKGVEETAIKELEEETGFSADRIEVVGEFLYLGSFGRPTPGTTRPPKPTASPRASKTTGCRSTHRSPGAASSSRTGSQSVSGA